ncbi:MAG TPA: Gfo/Idh/MocA family oxidoreductase [Flavobacteriales bacterium]|nr:Gfo/Idh/MocA family oxidoreductase [Flavobacteriales bacterium]HIO67548.1 Gfo/Idh/MocA family oxidoreductase [Flavobacteriales bacterium]
MKHAIIGASGHFEYALQAMAYLEIDRFVGFAPGSPDEDVKSAYQEHFEAAGTKYYDDYLEMLDKERPDVVVINPHYYLNGPITIACMERGIHCFVEKPICFNLEELAAIERLAKEGEAQIAAMMYYRYQPAFHAAIQAIEDGKIGVPLLITAQKSYKMGVKPPWTHSRAKFGGIIPWVGAHAIDLLYLITGGEIAAVTAETSLEGNHGFGEVEASALCCYRLNNGGNASINLDYLRPESAPTHGDDRLRVAGEKGVVEVINDKASLITDDGEIELMLSQEVPIYADFIRQVTTGEACRNPAEDVFGSAKLCIQTEEAANLNKEVTL